MRKNRMIIAAAIVALLVGWGCGSGGSKTSDPAPAAAGASGAAPAANPGGLPTVAVGQPIAVRDGGSKATVVVTKVDTTVKGSQFQPPKVGKYVAVTVVITATEGANDLGPSNFRLIGGDGTVYKDVLVIDIEPALAMGTEIAQGQKKEGKVVFDVDPAKLKGATIQVSDDGSLGLGSSDPTGYWTF